jgi:hypothetical protein
LAVHEVDVVLLGDRAGRRARANNACVDLGSSSVISAIYEGRGNGRQTVEDKLGMEAAGSTAGFWHWLSAITLAVYKFDGSE